MQLTTPACPIKDEFERKARAYVETLEWVRQVEVTMDAQPPRPLVADDRPPGLQRVAHVIAVSSCKGGECPQVRHCSGAMCCKAEQESLAWSGHQSRRKTADPASHASRTSSSWDGCRQASTKRSRHRPSAIALDMAQEKSNIGTPAGQQGTVALLLCIGMHVTWTISSPTVIVQPGSARSRSDQQPHSHCSTWQCQEQECSC